MRKQFMNSSGVLMFLLAVFVPALAQTYGTKGYAPGAWKPEELPQGLGKPTAYGEGCSGYPRRGTIAIGVKV